MSEESLPKVAVKHSCKVDVQEGKTYFWCSCGLSENQPFCDGSHKGTDFRPEKFVAQKDGMFPFCGCKHSKNGVRCDGSHREL